VWQVRQGLAQLGEGLEADPQHRAELDTETLVWTRGRALSWPQVAPTLPAVRLARHVTMTFVVPGERQAGAVRATE
jgi:hypothetical protein